MKNRVLKWFLILWAIVLTALISSLLTLKILGASGKLMLVTEDDRRILSRYGKLDTILQTLEDDYYTELDEDTLILGAVRGLMSAVDDPYTFYYTAEEMEDSKNSQNGLFHGVGMVIQLRGDDSIVVTRVYEDSGAYEAGIEPGDVLLAVDGSSVCGADGIPFGEISTYVKGEDDTYVELTLSRGEQIYTTNVRRGEVEASSINSCMLDGGIGYINIAKFTGDAAESFIRTLQTFESQGASGIIVDVRGGPGGLLTEVVAISDAVLPEGIITYMDDRQGNYQEERSSAEHSDIPMVVLVNGDSASASELFAAAVQDYERAKVVGTTTYGKGIVQTIVTFSQDGDGMQYTTASYYSPLGRSIHHTGLEPDICVEQSEGDMINVYDPDPSTDTQLRTAIEILKAQINETEG